MKDIIEKKMDEGEVMRGGGGGATGGSRPGSTSKSPRRLFSLASFNFFSGVDGR